MGWAAEDRYLSRKMRAVAIDPHSPAATLIKPLTDPLRNAGVKLLEPSTSDVVVAHGNFLDTLAARRTPPRRPTGAHGGGTGGYPTADGRRGRLGPAGGHRRRWPAKGCDSGIVGVDEPATGVGAADRLGVSKSSSLPVRGGRRHQCGVCASSLGVHAAATVGGRRFDGVDGMGAAWRSSADRWTARLPGLHRWLDDQFVDEFVDALAAGGGCGGSDLGGVESSSRCLDRLSEQGRKGAPDRMRVEGA
jgi:hypothetical protein